MIHYHSSSAGGTQKDALLFLKERHSLISYAYKSNEAIVLNYCKSFILDNGAFSLWKKAGEEINVNEYYKWVKTIEYHPGLDWVIIPDKIDGTEDENRELLNKWMDLELSSQSVPVYHYNESFEWLDYLISNFKTVALGSSGEWSRPNSYKWWGRTEEIMEIATDDKGKARCKLHGLRMLNKDIFTKIPLSSADSANAAINSGDVNRFGMYIPPERWQRAELIARRIEQYNSAPIWKPGIVFKG